MKKRITIAGCLMLLVGLLAAPAFADDYPPEVDDVVEEDEGTPPTEVESEVEETAVADVEETSVQANVLARTGGELVPLLLVGGLLAIVGAGVLIGMRRRGASETS